MRLKKLYSNKNTFHTVEFKSGVNFIVGAATKKNKSNTQKTYNGVGKSLLIKLIDFCLACDTVDEFSKKLTDWEFTLIFETQGQEYTATRSTLKQQKIVLNGEEISLDKFREYFADKVFGIISPISFLTWRTLMSRFLRPRKESYVKFDSTSSKEPPYTQLINTAYLLGLDIDLIEKKKGLKNELTRIETAKSNLTNDEIFKKYFTQNGGTDIDIEAANLEDKILDLKRILSSFEVSESYYDIQRGADDLKYEGQEVKNRITILQNSLKQIDKTLEIKTDITPDTITKLYEEAKQQLSANVVKTLKEVSEFHTKLLTERKTRILAEKKRISREITELEIRRKELGSKLDDALKFLGKHKALDEFVAINTKLANLTNSLDKLKSYKGLLQEYQNKTDEIGIAFSEENIRTNNYLSTAQSLLEQNLNKFRLISRRFYADKAGGIEVKQNKGNNQIRFDINVQIDDDTSDGVNEVKIFCFDLTVLLTKHNHWVNFIFHDSRLFSNIDPRQRATLFRLCEEYSKTDNFQYIATVNEDQVESVREHYSALDYTTIIENNIILRLTDESDSSKLLGIQANIDYEK
ncbi:DUF2326 domain-containing protein [Patescibacteria group bacterium]|nr:DUF2326 domain-containing protein [Patescibacteria group bacterium]MBP9709524.1 DUF2326 domain-containing protein [Patescibacteria group bacterium]